jgi:hypothetical protein
MITSMSRERIGLPPMAPPATPPVDEGPMRRELLRQIAMLDVELAALSRAWPGDPASPRRGPALLDTAELERIRDELVAALRRRA